MSSGIGSSKSSVSIPGTARRISAFVPGGWRRCHPQRTRLHGRPSRRLRHSRDSGGLQLPLVHTQVRSFTPGKPPLTLRHPPGVAGSDAGSKPVGPLRRTAHAAGRSKRQVACLDAQRRHGERHQLCFLEILNGLHHLRRTLGLPQDVRTSRHRPAGFRFEILQEHTRSLRPH